jgi:hypothetical protein
MRYVNTSMRAQLDEYMRARPAAAKGGVDALQTPVGKGKKRTAPVKGLAAKT